MNTRQDLGWDSHLIFVSDFRSYLNPKCQEFCGPADLIIYERNAVEQSSLDAIGYWQGLGKPVCMGLDDAYWMLPYSNPARNFWFHREHPHPDTGEPVEGGATLWLEKALRQVNGLISPNRLLLQDYSHITQNSYYLQNYAEAKWWKDLPPKEKSDKIVIGWGGSLSHYDSFHGSGIFRAIERITKRHSNIIWKICGSDERIFHQLPVSYYNKVHQAGVAPQDWPKIVKSFDIGLAPLWGVYDQRRSWIKGIEYALAGVPWIGIQGETYNDLADWPTGKLGPETVDFWEQAVEETIDNLEKLTKQAESLIPVAQDRFLAENNLDIYAKVYGQIIADFEMKFKGLPNVVKVGEVKTNGTEKESESLSNIVKVTPGANA